MWQGTLVGEDGGPRAGNALELQRGIVRSVLASKAGSGEGGTAPREADASGR